MSSLESSDVGDPSALVDVVVVSYNSAAHLRACVAPLAALDRVNVIVVDNSSSDGSLREVADVPVTTIARRENGGFAVGCNVGWRRGAAPYVLFLNPDASIDEPSLRRLVTVLQDDDSAGAVAPRIEHPDGSLAYSQRRFPSIVSTFSQALFLHRLFPQAWWADEIVRDEDEYSKPGRPDWVSGACILIRRSALEELGGWDEGYFLYCEDIDLCRRLGLLGLAVRYEPAALALHVAGQSAPSTATIPLLAASKLRYGRKTRAPLAAAVERIGIGLGALTHLIVSRGGLPQRLAHARALRAVIGTDRS